MRKIWNFAMAAIVIVASAGLFTACNKDDLGIDNSWDKGGIDFADTKLSAIEVLKSAESWNDDYTNRYYYAEPDGKGEYYHSDETPLGGQSWIQFSVMSDKLRFYYQQTMPPFLHYYKDLPIIEVTDNMVVFEGSSGQRYFEILKYDETKFLIETNFIKRGEKFPYCITILEKGKPTDSNWADKYIPYEEYLKALEELENK